MFQSPPLHSHTQALSLFVEYEHGTMATTALHDLHGVCLYPNDCQLDIRHATLQELHTFYGYSAPRFSEEQLELLQQIKRDLEGLKKIVTCLAPTPPSRLNLSVDVCSASACVSECTDDQQVEPKCKQQQLVMEAPSQIQFELESIHIPANISLDIESAAEERKAGKLDLALLQGHSEKELLLESSSAPLVALSVATPILPEVNAQSDDQVENLLTSVAFQLRQPEPPLVHGSNWKQETPSQMQLPHMLALVPCSSNAQESSANNSDLCGHIKNTPLMLPWDPGTMHYVVTESGIHLSATGLQPRDKLACSLSTSAMALSIDVLAEAHSGLLDIAVVPVPQVLDVTQVTTSTNLSADTPQDAQGLLSRVELQLIVNNDFTSTLEPDAAQAQSRLAMFRTLQRFSLSPIHEDECTNLAEKRQDLMKLAKIRAGLSLELHLLFLAIMCNEVVLWPNIQFAPGKTILLQPWDPGLRLFGMYNKLSTYKHGLLVRLPTACGVVCLQSHSVHQFFCCCFVVATILTWMAKLMELQAWLSWVQSVMVALVQLQPQSSGELSVLILNLARCARYTAWIWCHIDNLHYIHGSTNLAIPHWGVHIPSSEIWGFMYCHYATENFQWNTAVKKDTSFRGICAFLNRRAEVQRHFSCRTVLTDVLRGKTLFFVALLCKNSRRWLPNFFCNAKLLSVVDRLGKEKIGFIHQCTEAFVQLVASLVLGILDTVSSDIQQVRGGKRHGPITALPGRAHPKSTIHLSPVILHLLGRVYFSHRVGPSHVLLQLAVVMNILETPFQARDNFQMTLLRVLEAATEEPSVIIKEHKIQRSLFLGMILPDMKITNSSDASLTLEKLKAVGKSIVLSLIYVFYISTVTTSAYQEQQHVFEANFTQFFKSKGDTWDPGITTYRTFQPNSDTRLMDFTFQWTKFTNRMVGLHYKIYTCRLHSQNMSWIMELWIISFKPP